MTAPEWGLILFFTSLGQLGDNVTQRLTAMPILHVLFLLAVCVCIYMQLLFNIQLRSSFFSGALL